MSVPDLTFDHVGYAYGQLGPRRPRRQWALTEVTTTFRPGVITGLLGRNGSGKSTILSLAAGLRRPTAGTVTTQGAAVLENAAAVRDIALLGSSRSLIEDERIEDSMRLWAATRPHWDQAEADRLMEVFEVPRRTKPERLSLGQRSALDAVFALACHCPVLLLDEVHLGMDAVARRRFWDQLLAAYVREPATIVVSSHHVEEIEELLEDVVVVDHGRVVASGTADELRDSCAETAGGLPRRRRPSLTDLLVAVTSTPALLPPHPAPTTPTATTPERTLS